MTISQVLISVAVILKCKKAGFTLDGWVGGWLVGWMDRWMCADPWATKISFHRISYYRPGFLLKTKISALDKSHHFLVPVKQDMEHRKPEIEQTLPKSSIRCSASRLRHGGSTAILEAWRLQIGENNVQG